MVAMPLAHVSWAIADNEQRKACDAFFIDVFGAETAGEILLTPEMEGMGLDREERLMMVSDAMLIPIAPAGPGTRAQSPIGEMLRRSAAPHRWLGVALRVESLPEADAWFTARGFRLHYDPGMESHYFLISRGQAMGMRIEVLGHELSGDPRNDPAWTPAKWRNDHPLGIEGLQAIGLSACSLDEARALFAGRFAWPEVGAGYVEQDDADYLAFAMGDTVIEALCARDPASPLGRHARETKGICSLVLKVRSAEAAADYLRGRGLDLIGHLDERFAIHPAQCFDRLIWFSEDDVPGYPPLGSRLPHAARFPE